jgi:hypothetical protein
MKKQEELVIITDAPYVAGARIAALSLGAS